MESEKLPGWNAGHYRKHFERMQRAQRRWLPGWNWAAFLHSTGWFWYRRMYGWSVLNLIAPVLLLLVLVLAVQWIVPESDLKIPSAVGAVAYLLLVFGALPLYADSLYLYRLHKDGAMPRAPSVMTAVGALLVIVVPAMMTYAVVSAQRDYSQRERIAEGLSAALTLKAPISEFYARERRLPGPQEAAQFNYSSALKHTASVGWDSARRAIVGNMGERFDGGRFEMAAVEKDGTLQWVCRPIELDRKYFPADCR